MNRVSYFLVALATVLISACASAPQSLDPASGNDYRAALTARAPAGGAAGGPPGPAWPDGQIYDADGPYPVDLADVPAGQYDPNNQLHRKGAAGRPELPIPEDLARQLREEAMSLPPRSVARSAEQAGLAQLGPTPGTGFDSLDYTECCGGGGNVPPDPELAVGPDHIVAVVNVAFEIYDKSGNSLSGPITFSSFFAGTPGCSNTGVFDPNALYDEEYDRFIVGIDGNGDNYCIAASASADPAGQWNTYAFSTTVNGSEFFDYPHAGVGRDAIFMGANIFRRSFSEARVWAVDKLALYGGGAVSVVGRSTGLESTPQPMHLHGWDQGTWPASGPHYILTDGSYDGAQYGVWSWEDPFGADVFGKVGDVDLEAASGWAAGFPIDVPQKGGSNLQANDWRVQDAEYRNGMIWTATAISCNPGGGTVGCVRWAQIDPSVPAVVDAGVVGTDDVHRTFGDVAVNHCDDMAIGYTRTSDKSFPGVFVSGRESADPAGTVQPEVLVKAGEASYDPFDSAPHRWGDYTEMTIDPDGQTFWYLGEYSKGIAGTNWGTYVASFSFDACAGGPVATGTIQGTVTDSVDGSPIANASVSADSGQGDTTDANGDYMLIDVPVGTPVVTASASGYEPASRPVTVSDGGTSFADFALDPVPAGSAVQPRSITVSTVNRGRGNKGGEAVVVVEDNLGQLVADAVVTGDFIGSINESGLSGDPTGADGSTTIATTDTARGGISLTFCVTSITHPTLNDYSGPAVCGSL